MKLRVVVVDDEPIARRRSARLARAEREVEVVAECAGGREAVETIRALRPDLVLLDVQMPEVDGFGVVAALEADQLPAIVFVTAHDEYAIRAFEVRAVDYLLKPYETARFQTAFRHAREHLERLSAAQTGRRLKAMVQQLLAEDSELEAELMPGGAEALGGPTAFGGGGGSGVGAGARAPARHIDRLVVKRGGRVLFVRVAEVDWFEAAENYVRVHVGKTTHMVRGTMNALEASLDPAQFARIHRATIVNLDRIKELQPWFAGDYVVLLRDGTQLKLTRTFRESLQSRLYRTA